MKINKGKRLNKNKGPVLQEALTQKQKNYVLNYIKEHSFFPCDNGKNFYFLVPVDNKHIKMTPKFKKQLEDEGLYGNTFIGGMTDKAELPIDMMWLPIYGDPNRYVTKWLSHSFNSCFDSDLRDRGRGLSKRLDIDKISEDRNCVVVKILDPEDGEARAVIESYGGQLDYSVWSISKENIQDVKDEIDDWKNRITFYSSYNYQSGRFGKKLTESKKVILHFDLEDGTHKALPFDSEEDALEYMDSDDFPIGEWVGDYKIETIKEPKKEKPKAAEEDYEFQVLQPEDIEKLDELVKEIKDHNEDGWCDWVDYAIKVGRKYLGESLARYGEGECTPFEDLIDECETFVYYRTTVVDKLLNKRLALQKELEQMKESTNLKENTFESYWANGNAEALKKRFHEICSELGVWTKDDKGCENFGLQLRIGHSYSDEDDLRLRIVSPKYYLSDTGADMWARPNSTEDFDEWVTKYIKEYSWLFKEKDSDAYKHLVKSENPEPWNTFVASEGSFRKALRQAFKSNECKYIDMDEQYDMYGEEHFEVDSTSDDAELSITFNWCGDKNPDDYTLFKFDGDLNYTATMNGETVTGQGYEDAAKQYVLRIANKYAEGEFAKEYEPECYELRVYLRQDFYTKASKNIWQTIEGILEDNCNTYTNYEPEDWVDDRAAVWTSIEVDDLKRVLDWLKKRRSVPRIEIWDENKKNVTPQFWTPKVEESTKKFTETVVKYTTDIGEATAYELNQQVKKILWKFGYSFGGNQSERPVCAPKKYYLRDRNLEGHTTYLLSVKGEYYDEIIIQICDSRVYGMANYTIRSPEGVLWMGQTPKEFEEDIYDMTTGYNEM